MEVEETVEEAGMVLQYRAWLGRRLAGEVGHAGHVLIEPLARWLLVRFLAKKSFGHLSSLFLFKLPNSPTLNHSSKKSGSEMAQHIFFCFSRKVYGSTYLVGWRA